LIQMENEPRVLEDIAGQAMFIKDAMGWRQSGKYPKAVLLHGPPGTGKSSAALVLTREMQGEWFDPVNYTVTNASDDRGIDFIRNELKQWSGVRAIGGARRSIIADEADGLTPAAQDAARVILEDNASNTLFIFTANDLSKIKPAIKSRCLVYEFKPLKPNEGAQRLMQLFSGDTETFEQLMSATGGDLRSAIAIVESGTNLKEYLSSVEIPASAALAAISGEWMEMRNTLYKMIDKGMSLNQIMRSFHQNLTEFFDMDSDTTFTVMAVLGEMVPHMYEWPIGSYSFVDCLTARLKQEVEEND
jgi:DNA polymerase III delta prime subunit